MARETVQVNASVEHAFEVLTDLNLSHQADKSLLESTILERISENLCIVKNRYQIPLVSNR